MTSPLPPVLERYIEGLKTRDVQKIANTVSEDLVFRSAGRTLTKPQFLGMLRAIYAAFPDWHYDHDAPQIEADAIAIRWRQGGTHTGTLAMSGLEPIPPTGRAVKIPEQRFRYTVEGDHIVEIRPDPVPGGAPGGILEQIGVRKPPL